MGHAKEKLSNPSIISPCIYFNINFQKDYVHFYDNMERGESGRMLENFISSKCLIRLMKIKKIFGEFLDYKYFIKDFREINERAISEFKKTNNYFNIKNKMKLALVLETLFLFVVRQSGKGKGKSIILFKFYFFF